MSSDVSAGVSKYVALGKAAPVVTELTGKPCSSSSVFRWRRIGTGNVRLRTIFFAGAHHTTREWLMEYFSAAASAKNAEVADHA